MSRLEERIRIEADGAIVACSGKVEIGQGIRVAFARLVAGALHVPLGRVRVVLGDTALTPPDLGTFGSLSVRTDGALLARAAAFAMLQLLDRAAAGLGLEAGVLTAQDGFVVAPDGRRASYAELVAEAPLTGEIPEDVPLPPHAAERAPTDDRRALVTGAARFVADLRLPGMRFAAVLHPPEHGARLVALDDTAARTRATIVRDGDFVGAVADRPADARAAVRALVAHWAPPSAPPAFERRLALRDDPGTAHALGTASVAIDQHYELPHVANAPLGPSAAIADVRGDTATLHAATQRPFGLRDEAARLLGFAVPRVRVIPALGAGSFGRNNSGDAALEAVRLSRAAGCPVLVEWSRADELHAAPDRPRMAARVRAGVDGTGRLVAWASDIVTNPHVYFGDLEHLPDAILAMTTGRNAVPPYQVPVGHVEVRIVSAAIRTAALRSLAAAPNVFAIESAIDELADRAGIDPLELRLRNTDLPRLRRVLDCVAERSGWARRPRGGALGYGLACAIYNETYVAQVAEVELAGDRVRVRRAWCALDCGTLIDPDGARNQIEGAIVHATSWALIEQLHHAGPAVLASGWDDYPIARFGDAPVAIDIAFTDDGRTPPTGVGEPGAVPFGAAIASAVAAASGVRIRTQPIRPHDLASGRRA